MTDLVHRVLKLDGVNNFRDYGGWRAADGARLATGRLFRCAHLHRASDADIARIGALGITIVTDLRHPEERRSQPSAWIGKLPLAVIEEPEHDAAVHASAEAPHMAAFRASDFSFAAMRELLARQYEIMPYDPRHVAMFSRYFDWLAHGEGAILIHCAAGKDRTGILAWLTHRLLGVHPDDALADYMLSNIVGNTAEHLPHVKRSMEQTYGRRISDESLVAVLRVEPVYIQSCEAALVLTSGSVEGYMTDLLGVDAAKRRRICERLLS